MNAYSFDGSETPDSLIDLAGGIKQFVNRGEMVWTPNEIITHRYNNTDFIGRHRDYTEAYGLVAVLTLDGSQEFYVELDESTEPTKITMEPGTLTMLRGFTGDPEQRPYHWVDKPVSQRLAMSIRDMRQVWTSMDGSWN
jgi:alkylated DNA repair dioxygenase AlkB